MLRGTAWIRERGDGAERWQRFRTSADGNQLTIDTVETYRGGAAGSLVRGFVREQ